MRQPAPSRMPLPCGVQQHRSCSAHCRRQDPRQHRRGRHPAGRARLVLRTSPPVLTARRLSRHEARHSRRLSAITLMQNWNSAMTYRRRRNRRHRHRRHHRKCRPLHPRLHDPPHRNMAQRQRPTCIVSDRPEIDEADIRSEPPGDPGPARKGRLFRHVLHPQGQVRAGGEKPARSARPPGLRTRGRLRRPSRRVLRGGGLNWKSVRRTHSLTRCQETV